MVSWSEFRQRAPELAGQADERFRSEGLLLLGSNRSNGWPRISPVECWFTGEHLALGMMWQSRKALDLLRDPRCALHSTQCTKEPTAPDIKIYGRAVAVTDGGQWQSFFDQVAAETGNVFTEAHLFFIDVMEAAAWWVADNDSHFETWKADT
jgi:hypothetical protein